MIKRLYVLMWQLFSSLRNNFLTNKKTLKSTPLSYSEISTHLYDGIAATRVSGWGPSSKRSTTVDTNDEKEIPDIEEIQSNAQNDLNLDVEKTPKKGTKASQKLAKITEFQNEMTIALKLMVQANSGPSLKECKEKLNNLGWGSTTPLHKMALGIFCESAKYREQWMLLENNKNADWVKMVSTKLRFNA
ncbi:hypothetical protein POM88_003390 [Heracleum sosnowskyi]|uniref:Uncharacterized protein n=1 Tax=Heracleum sosnowskyi TaxID=360622 RepID=A0AAD8N6U1_9APIA|nr:hypothetical protein POM88_003390 [Heracleum sosnowskyi]